MAARLRPTAAAVALTVLLAGCAAPVASPLDAPAAPTTSVPSTPSHTPSQTPSQTPSADPTADWQEVATENGLVSIHVPATWSVEHGGETIDESLWGQTMLVRNSIGQGMALLSLSEGGDRGGACGWEVDGVFQADDDSMLPARIHSVERLDLGNDLVAFETPGEPYLVAATVQRHETFRFHVGFLPAVPEDGLVPCFWYDDVAVPADFPNLMLGTPFTDDSSDVWLVDSFDEGEAYTQTEEFATLMDVMRSVELHP